MKKLLFIIMSLLLILGLVACGEENTNSKNAELGGKVYTYEGEGFGGDFTIQLNDDGSSVYYEGLLSSYMGISKWTVEDDILTITDSSFTNKFKVNGNELEFIEEGSTNFPYVKLKDGDKFIYGSGDTKQNTPNPSEVVVDNNNKEEKITSDMAYEGVNNYCHSEYDWSQAEDNPKLMYVSLVDETENEYKVVFRSYTGSFIHFYVDKTTGITRMVEVVPSLAVEEEAGTIDIHDYLN